MASWALVLMPGVALDVESGEMREIGSTSSLVVMVVMLNLSRLA